MTKSGFSDRLGSPGTSNKIHRTKNVFIWSSWKNRNTRVNICGNEFNRWSEDGRLPSAGRPGENFIHWITRKQSGAVWHRYFRGVDVFGVTGCKVAEKLSHVKGWNGNLKRSSRLISAAAGSVMIQYNLELKIESPADILYVERRDMMSRQTGTDDKLVMMRRSATKEYLRILVLKNCEIFSGQSKKPEWRRKAVFMRWGIHLRHTCSNEGRTFSP